MLNDTRNKSANGIMNSRLVMLYKAIIIRAYNDYVNMPKEYKEEIDIWLETPDFIEVCELARANPEVIKKHIKNKSLGFKRGIRAFHNLIRLKK